MPADLTGPSLVPCLPVQHLLVAAYSFQVKNGTSNLRVQRGGSGDKPGVA